MDLTPEQTENLAKHFYVRGLRVKYGREFSDAQEVFLWNASASDRERYGLYAGILAEMFPDCIAPYLDSAPF